MVVAWVPTPMFKVGDRVINSFYGLCVVYNVKVQFGDVNYYVRPMTGEPFWSWQRYLRAIETKPEWDEESL